jgi:hypothetical protein
MEQGKMNLNDMQGVAGIEVVVVYCKIIPGFACVSQGI